MSKPRTDATSHGLAEQSGEHARPSHITGRPAGRVRFDDAAAQRASAASEGRLEAPATDEMLFTVLELNRTVGVEMQEEAIVHGYVQAMQRLFPQRRFAVRLFAKEGGVSLAHATDDVDPAWRARVVVSQSALDRHDLDGTDLERVGAVSSEEYEPLFTPPGAGFDVPLVSGDRLVGVLSVEYAPGLAEPPFDRSLVVPLAVQLSAALRNARLLRESDHLRANMERLLDHANAPIVVVGQERELRILNRAFLAMVGRTREELLGRDFLSVLPENERGRMLPIFIRAMRGEPTSNFEIRVPRARATPARFVVDTASILSAEGEVEGVIAIGRDLTELRRLEEQVIQAEKLATLGQLAAGVVHELNNPLTSISVYGEHLLQKGQRAGQEPSDLEKLRRIVESADRILKFTRDLVAYARPSTEEPAFVRVEEVVEQSLLFCEHVVSEVSATLTTRFEDGQASVYAVKGQLHQVFINLITNACHALPAEDGQIHVHTYTAEGGQVHVTVTDNGHGIASEQRERIFEPFFSTKGEGKGTGLGLSIVRNIVQQHGGEIDVGEGEGGGTVFTVRLPCRTRE